MLYKDRIFLFQDHDGTASLRSFVAAFDAKTGKVLWKKDRVETVGWGTPIVIDAGDHDELIVSSQRRIYAYNPDTGDELWTVRGNTFEVIPDAGRRPRPRVLLVRPRGSDVRDSAGRQGRRHRHARRVVVAEGIAVRAVGHGARRLTSIWSTTCRAS